jgi:seryl-tRNA synthetase
VIDRRLLLSDLESVAARLETKGVSRAELEAARAALEVHRSRMQQLEAKRAESRLTAEGIKAAGGPPDEQTLEAARALRSEIAELEAAERDEAARLEDMLLRIPNLPPPLAPVGTSENDNVVLETHGYEESDYAGREFRPHWEIAEEFGIFDPKRAARISGSMFSLLRGDGARLLRALVNFGLDLHRERYEEILPPHMVRTETFTSTGHLPKFEDDAYRVRDDDLWLIPTGEVPLTSLHGGEILEESDLPRRYMAYTVCFRREAGSAGKDTRGMQRLHEFHKVELVKLTTEKAAAQEFEDLLQDARLALDRLELPYRLVDLCTADLTFSSARIIDLEVFAPGTQRWLECSSVGYFSDFQTRRAQVRYRPTEGGRPQLVHALNASAMATPRVWAALIEHGLSEDGNTIRLPPALHPYFGSDEIRKP